jgi:C-terminal processing protease CtpA/Prc
MIRALIVVCALAGVARADDPVDELERAIDEDYAHRDGRKIDWRARFQAFRPRLQAAKTTAEFVAITGELLAPTEDQHITITDGTAKAYAITPRFVSNFDKTIVAKYVSDVQSDHRCVSWGHARPDVGYVVIGQWDQACFDSAAKALDALASTRVLVIDVRPNIGGNDAFALQLAGRFVSTSTPFASVEVRQSGKLAPKATRLLSPQPPRYGGKVGVLMGPMCLSSCEGFLLMMRAAHAKLFGARSFGSSGNPLPHRLSNGVTVSLPSWRQYDLDGIAIEGRGIEPDVTIAWPNDGSDPVLGKAIEKLAQSPR